MSIIKRAVASFLAIALTLPAYAVPPTPNRNNIPAYIQALEQAQDPQSMAIKAEIANGPAALATETQRAQAAGIPMSLAELSAMPPPSQNAATIYQKLDAMRAAKPLGMPSYAQNFTIGYIYTPAQLAAVQKIIDSRPRFFRLLDKAAAMPVCVFPADWAQGEQLNVPQLFGSLYRSPADVNNALDVNAQSFLAAKEGHYQRAVIDQGLVLNMAEQEAVGPKLSSYINGMGADIASLQSLQGILALAGPNTAVDAAAERSLQTNNPRPWLKETLIDWTALNVMTFQGLQQNPMKLSEPGEPPLSARETTFAREFVDAAEARYLSGMLQLIADPSAKPPEFTSTSLGPSETGETVLSTSLDPVTVLVSYFPIDCSYLLGQQQEFSAWKQVTLAAAAVLAYKAKTGSFPNGLPGDFPDAYTGMPLRYRTQGKDGFMVYSMGKDETCGCSGILAAPDLKGRIGFSDPAPVAIPLPADMLQ